MWVLVTLLFIMMLLIVYYSIRNGISPMPTSPRVKKAFLEFMPKKLDGKIYELGSAWGGLARDLARRYPHCTVYAFESSPVPFLFSWVVNYLFPLKNMHLIYGDFFEQSFKEADLLVCYLYLEAMIDLEKKCKEELPRGALLVSHTFALPNWKLEKVERVGDLYNTPMYLYRL